MTNVEHLSEVGVMGEKTSAEVGHVDHAVSVQPYESDLTAAEQKKIM